MGAWIEIDLHYQLLKTNHVAPYMGAWIEIYFPYVSGVVPACRSLHGSVD